MHSRRKKKRKKKNSYPPWDPYRDKSRIHTPLRTPSVLHCDFPEQTARDPYTRCQADETKRARTPWYSARGQNIPGMRAHSLRIPYSIHSVVHCMPSSQSHQRGRVGVYGDQHPPRWGIQSLGMVGFIFFLPLFFRSHRLSRFFFPWGFV